MEINRVEVLMPGGIELIQIAESKMEFDSSMSMLSIGYGTGEIECYLTNKYKIQVIGVDISRDLMLKAQKKAEILKLRSRIQFKIGNGTSLQFPDQNFDIVYCMGSIIDFFKQGLSEIYRVLKPTGKAIIGEVLWLKNEVPKIIRNSWEKDSSLIHTKEENDQIIVSKGFRILFSESFHEFDWWENYYKDRDKTSYWAEEQALYQKSQNFIGIGLFIISR
jgi:ubiquinone/menaquinone biosynthesis C-methylase UbiE